MKHTLTVIAVLVIGAMIFAFSGCSENTQTTAPVVAGVQQAPGNNGISFTTTTPCSDGCTRTPGYWKNHTDDPVWNNLPNGPNTIFAGTGLTWLQVMSLNHRTGDAYLILARHFAAAKLNVYAGACIPPEVAIAGPHAVQLLGMYDGDPYPRSMVVDAVRQDFISTAEVLGMYNEGLIGPGHCDEQTDVQ